MKVYSGTQPEVYAVSGQELRIHWNIREVPAPSMDDKTETQWEANEALCHVKDSRDVIIEKIIGSVLSHSKEIALINNQTVDKAAYDEYQAFRVEAKKLADGYYV